MSEKKTKFSEKEGRKCARNRDDNCVRLREKNMSQKKKNRK